MTEAESNVACKKSIKFILSKLLESPQINERHLQVGGEHQLRKKLLMKT
jgi:hypothetical protein